MALWITVAVLGGMLLGWAVIPPTLVDTLDGMINGILAFLVFLVGVDIGRNREALLSVRRMGFKILLVPAAIGAGSLLGAAAAGCFLTMPVKELLAVGAGFGWYSLSGVLISSTYNLELGTTAFLANVIRELMAFVLIPMLVPYTGKLAAIAPGGATTMDSTLPLITRATDSQTALIAFVSGLVLTAAVPILIPLILAM